MNHLVIKRMKAYVTQILYRESLAKVNTYGGPAHYPLHRAFDFFPGQADLFLDDAAIGDFGGELDGQTVLLGPEDTSLDCFFFSVGKDQGSLQGRPGDEPQGVLEVKFEAALGEVDDFEFFAIEAQSRPVSDRITDPVFLSALRACVGVILHFCG
jgi:hypothetical protein